MVKERTLSTRHHAVGMIKGRTTQEEVIRDLGVGVAMIRRWQTRNRQGETLENRTGRGRKSAISQMAKNAVAKSAFKRHHFTRTLAKKLTAKKHRVSKSAIYRYLKTCLQLKPLKLKLQPRLTKDQKRSCMGAISENKS